MKTFWIQVFALLLVTFGAIAVYSHPEVLQVFNLYVTPPAKVEQKLAMTKLQILDGSILDNSVVKAELNIEVASTPGQRSKGLGGRQALAANSGMLFTFEKQGKYSFWMKGMNFPLDFIWILDNKVVDLLPNAAKPQAGQSDLSLPIYAPVTEINKVLEVNAGFISAHNIKVGDKIEVK